jgi:inositol transport system ATP-binding protein
MVGRKLASASAAPPAAKGEPALAVRGLGRAGAFRDVEFQVRRGEILGLAGLMGAGRTEVVSALFGLVPADRGEIRVDGRSVRIRCPADAIRYGIGMVTEDRTGYGLVPAMNVRHNITLASLKNCCRGPLIRHTREAEVAGASLRALAIKTSGHQAVSQLSGGNQQKVVIARTLLAEPSIVILDEPTRGIDIGAKAEVYGIIARLAQQGKAVILVSSELPEVLSLSDRVLVMREGEITAELDPARTSQEEVLRYAMPV